jgi:YidC/Oxa1 family membrane protein insertase
MHTLWNVIFYQPIYNALVFIVGNVTFGDIGFAIILLTIIVKLILSPLTKKSIKSQILMKKMEPELQKIKKDFPNKEEQAKKTFELYKKYGTSPFSGCLVILIQLPVIFALYYVFYKNSSIINTSLIYSFINIPAQLHTKFLGLLEIASNKNIILGLLAGLSQFTQGYLATPAKPKNVEIIKDNNPKTFQEELSSSMQMNVKYILPVFIAFIAYQLSAAVALYWITSNIFTIVQEWHIRRVLAKNSV